jgi:TonB family protein
VDPVSRVLAERESSRPRFFPWVIVAASLHGFLAGAIFLFGRAASARPSHLPVVSVKLVRPDRPPSRRAAAGRPRPTVAVPTPVPTRAATPVPLPTQAPEQPRPSDEAMAMPDSKATPAPELAEPEPAAGRRGRGLSLGEASARSVPGIPSDFHFTYYVERMLALIETRWYKPAAPAATKARLRYRIHRDGRVDGIVLEQSSGVPSFDRAALRALYAANPLPPLPPAYGKPTLTVHLTFTSE